MAFRLLRPPLPPIVRLACSLLAAFLLTACGSERLPVAPPAERLFTRLPAAYTGIGFENRLTDTEALNVFTYRNYYNGGGVGIGDLNGDGLPDLFLTANQGANRLYLNEGDFRFRDVTEAAGVGGRRPWSTGVSLVDLNGDGLLDLYVSNAGLAEGAERANELYLNEGADEDGVPVFREAAAEYGIADEGYTTHAAFFDYDKDGDLDLYLLNNSPRPVSSFGLRNIRHTRHDGGGDRLYRNDPGPGQARRFTDVSEEAGIFGSEITFGLGVTVGDVDRDGWMDIYISNDFFERDYLYRNRGDGTFEEVLEAAMPYISLSSMGADVADVDNDGRPELYVTDMLPESDRRLKTTSAFEGWDLYQAKLRNGYHHQYMRNMLHRNNGDGTFSEIGQIAGVSATDWSWAALFADFDLDGYKDLFVTNGIYRDVTDQDFIAFLADEVNRKALQQGAPKEGFLRLVKRIPSHPISNYAFHNDGAPGSGPPDQGPGQARQALTFTNRAAEWGLDAPGFSNGAAYGDLDRDGDLDLVVSNVNEEPFLYRNNADTLLDHRYLQVELVGEAPNRQGIGAKVTITHDGALYYFEQMPMRGFQSSVDPVLTAGLGGIDTVEAVVVEWPDDRVQVFTGVATDRRLVVRQAEARPGAPEWMPRQEEPPRPVFAEMPERAGLPYRHVENPFVDFDREPLIPRMLSTEGPRAAVGDVDGDGLDDLFLGGAKGTPGQLFVQKSGGFAATNEALFERDKSSEDVDAAFFDADGDGDLDLYVVSGGSEFSRMAPSLQDRLYRNDGRGRFERAGDALPDQYQSGSRVVPADYDADGDLDLFVGSRTIPWRYGHTPRSVLLENDGRGRFTDITDRAAPELAEAGMVTDALWSDYDADGRLDLIVVGEWMPIALFRNAGGGRLERQAGGLEGTEGWWNRVAAADFDGDGDTDLVAGNLGLNTRIQASETRPVTMHVADFDRNGSFEQVISLPHEDGTYPMPLRNELVRQLGFLENKFPTHADYAGQRVEDLFTPEQLAQAVVRRARLLSTAYLENLGDGTFRVQPLPFEAQLAPVYGMLPEDFDGDGHQDLLLAGNFYGVKPELGRMDASHGLLLRGDGRGNFTPVPARGSGFRVQGQARDLRLVHHDRHGPLVLVTKNDDTPQLFRIIRVGEREVSRGAWSVDR